MSVRNPQTPEEHQRRHDQYAKSYAKRKRLLAISLRRGVRCQFRKGRYGVCNAVLRDCVDALGRVVPTCDMCVRRENGVCRTCPLPVAGKVGWAYYCAECKRKAMRRDNAQWVKRNRERKNASVRAWRKRQKAA